MNGSQLFALLVACSLLGVPSAARAQFSTPRPIDDIDIPAPKPAAQPAKPADSEEPEPAAPVEDELDQDVFVPGREKLAPAVVTPAPSFSATVPDAGGPSALDAGTNELVAADAGMPGDAGVGDGGLAGEPDAGAAAEAPRFAGPQGGAAKPILLPPREGEQQLQRAWQGRQQALASRSFRTAGEHESRLAALRDELGFDNLFGVGAAIAHEAEQLLKTDPIEAKRRALLAASLAPDLPYAHWMVARAAWAEDILNVGYYGGAAVDALSASLREPRWRAALAVDAAAALLFALLVSGALTLLLVFGRHARYLLHDLKDLLPSGASSGQAALLAMLLVLLPAALGFGLFGVVAAATLAIWLYLGRSERLVLGLFLCLLGLVPLGASKVARFATFMGTRAETIYLVERGGMEGARVEGVLRALAEQPDPSFQVTFTVGRLARRNGDIQKAIEWLRRAAELRPGSAEALLELGNALFLFGDLDGARETYDRAAERAPGRGEASFNLARLFARRSELAAREDASSELSRSQEYVQKTIAIDPKLGLLAAGEVDYRANRFLVGMPLQMDALLEMAQEEARPSRIEGQVAGILFGKLPGGLSPLLALLTVALLTLLGVVGGALAPSTPCNKCGRPVCRRCDVEVVGPGLCGQCVYVFNQRGLVDPTARGEKEMGIRRFQLRKQRTVKLASLCLSGAGQVLLGRTLSGSAVLGLVCLLAFPLIFWSGVVQVPLGRAPAVLKIVPALLGILLLWGLSARRAFAALKPPAPPKE